ncbi:hypothetical protein CGMCC3_g15041 [Colletotrichum fructicola]|nr:uncharacterized protein CGMCC3_g15041 [Colletotrichum fructicola]KAE9568873.1 hypothetical protein CGMCC3_g15041 [Colletotrichum fructicola]
MLAASIIRGIASLRMFDVVPKPPAMIIRSSIRRQGLKVIQILDHVATPKWIRLCNRTTNFTRGEKKRMGTYMGGIQAGSSSDFIHIHSH